MSRGKARIVKSRRLASLGIGIRLWSDQLEFVQDVVTRDPEQNLGRIARRGIDLVKLEMEGRITIDPEQVKIVAP